MKRVNFITANVSMTVKELKRRVENRSVTFDNAVQRGLVWDDERKSYLIDSILQGYAIPCLYAKRGSNGSFDMLDGKQRSNAIVDFLNNRYALTGMSEGMEDYEGATFDQLDTEDKENILDYSLTITYFDNISNEEVRELFFRLNNGKPLTNFEQVKAKCKSLDIAQEIAETSPVFNDELTGKKMSTDKKLELVYKAWAMLNLETPCLEKKTMNPLMVSTSITPEQKKELSDGLLRIYDAFKWLKDSSVLETAKINEKVRKRIITPTHLVSILPFAVKSLNEDQTYTSFGNWLKKFYSGTRRASFDEVYNDNAARGCARTDSIKKRLERLEVSYNLHFHM